MIRIILIRHGRTAWNLPEGQGQYFRGTTDLPLAEEGVAQAEATAQRLARVHIDAIYASPLQRAAHTAAILAAPHGLDVHTLTGLSSMSYGEWAGLLTTEVAQRWPDLYAQYHTDPFGVQVPGGDCMAGLRDRAVASVHEVLRRHAGGGCAVLVSHEAVCRTLTCTLAGMPNDLFWRFRQSLCNLTVFDYDPAAGGFALVQMNDACHLEPSLPRAKGSGTRILLIRHGQTAWNEGAGEERFRGRTDLPLDAAGFAQARALADKLKAEPIAALYASPLMRARQAVEPLADELGLPIRSHGGLLDINYGDFQGQTHREAAAAYPDLYALWRTAPSRVTFPGGEGLAAVQDRFIALLEEVAAEHPGQTVALVGHQVVNKVAVCTLLELGLDAFWRVQQDTCGTDVFQQAGGAWHTLLVNDSCGLPQ